MDETTPRGANQSESWPAHPDELGADDVGDAEVTSEFEAPAPIETPTESFGYAPPDSGP